MKVLHSDFCTPLGVHFTPHTLKDIPNTDNRRGFATRTPYIYDEPLLSVTVQCRQNPTILILRVARAAKTFIMCETA